MKRYLCFAGQEFYPGYPDQDYYGDFDTMEAAIIRGAEEVDSHGWYKGWICVLNTATGKWLRLNYNEANQIEEYTGP